MSQFRAFANAVAAQFAALSQSELYRTAISGDDLWALYLASFPPGTNPIYRVRTEHDGSYDRSFIRKVGNLVRLDADGSLTSLWDVIGMPAPYDVVAEALSEAVKTAPLDTLFRTKETKLGVVSNVELKDGVTTQYHHFHADVAAKHRTAKPDDVIGEFNTTVGVIRRGFTELTTDAVNTVLDLIASNALYRGAEFQAGLQGFRASQQKFLAAPGEQARQAVCFSAYGTAGARIRNTAIGTLLQDLSEGTDVEKAVGAFERMVAPSNYKRPTALITQGMIDKAMDTIDTLGLRPALERRFAVLADISVNDVLWVDNSVQGLMRDGLRDLLDSEAKPVAVDSSKAKPIAIDDFMATIAPTAAGIELFFANQHRGNLMSVTAPVHADAPGLFKWGNAFAWSYNGNIADSEMRRAVQEKGGRVDGVFRFTHQWNYDKRNASLMDLHVFMPGHGGQRGRSHGNYGNAERVGWNHRKHLRSGGVQDVDYTQAAPVGYVPVENITFPDLAKMPEGTYHCAIHNWAHRKPTDGGFKAEIEFAGQVFEYEYVKPLKQDEWVEVAEVTLKNGQFSIEHKLPHGAASHALWGLQTERFVKVNTVLNSPNHWDGQPRVGNKHWFFILEGCQNDEPTRGIYNEFLKPELEAHRKVFEVLGNKTKCVPSREQLSGLGFSSTKRDAVIVRVTTASSSRLYQLQF